MDVLFPFVKHLKLLARSLAPYFLFFRKRKRFRTKGGRGVGAFESEGFQIIWLRQFGAAFDVSQDDNEIVFGII